MQSIAFQLIPRTPAVTQSQPQAIRQQVRYWHTRWRALVHRTHARVHVLGGGWSVVATIRCHHPTRACVYMPAAGESGSVVRLSGARGDAWALGRSPPPTAHPHQTLAHSCCTRTHTHAGHAPPHTHLAQTRAPACAPPHARSVVRTRSFSTGADGVGCCCMNADAVSVHGHALQRVLASVRSCLCAHARTNTRRARTDARTDAQVPVDIHPLEF